MQSSIGEHSSCSHDGLALLSPAASWAIWSLGASLVREVGPQAAGKQSLWMDPSSEASIICRSWAMLLINIFPHSPDSFHCALAPSRPLGKMSLPIGMCRWAFSYDDALEDPAPMTPPPSDICSIPWKPVITECKYQHLDKTEEGTASVSFLAVTPSPATDSSDKALLVKAKATHVIMSSLITEQTQESIQRFEQQAGLRDAGYTPHKGLTTEETKYLRVAEALRKLKLQSGETAKEEKHPASAQSTPSSTGHLSPKQKSRGRFPSGSSTALPAPNPHTMDPGSGNDRNSADKWSLFGP